MFKKIHFILFIMILVLGFSCAAALAQDASDTSAEVSSELKVDAEELDIAEPGAFYWLRNFSWDVQAFFTRDPIKKAELKLKKASNQLLRIRQIVEDNPYDDDLQAKLEEISENYSELVDDIDARIEEFRAENPDDDRLKDFLDKYVVQRLRHQEILENMENIVPEEVRQRIQEHREEQLEKFGEVMNKLQNKEEFKERLKEALGEAGEEIKRQAVRLNIIEELEEKALPEIRSEIREKINEFKQEQATTINLLRSKLREVQQEQESIREEVQQRLQIIQQEQAEVREETQEMQMNDDQPGLLERIREKIRINR